MIIITKNHLGIYAICNPCIGKSNAQQLVLCQKIAGAHLVCNYSILSISLSVAQLRQPILKLICNLANGFLYLQKKVMKNIFTLFICAGLIYLSSCSKKDSSSVVPKGDSVSNGTQYSKAIPLPIILRTHNGCCALC